VTGFADRLNEQLGDAFAASQQYLAMGVYYRVEMLPRLSAVCYDRALEQRDRALAIVPGIPAPETAFADVVAPLQSAVERERRMSDRAGQLVRLARDGGDHGSEQFVKRLIGDQAQGLASLLSLLTVVRRCRRDPFRAEEFLATGLGERAERGRFARADPAVEPDLAIA
jgi:ferritin